MPLYLFYMVIFGQIITLASCFSHKRKNKNLLKSQGKVGQFLDGRPGMFRIGDLNGNNQDRLMWIALFISIIEALIIIALFGPRYIPMPNPDVGQFKWGGAPWDAVYRVVLWKCHENNLKATLSC